VTTTHPASISRSLVLSHFPLRPAFVRLHDP
jgi:hypothetical protein